ncbi:MAG: 30S ribosomal protein S4 [Candidatus Vogelbacteria bacterium]|nr:30S ribosomal protein S4 [Candidatus Vogelbacteria bacterium]
MRIGPKYKIARRLGDRIFPKTQGTKFTVSGTEKKQRGKKGGRRNSSEYGAQLIEKQKAKYTYGTTEKQFSNYVKATRETKGIPAAALYVALEKRLDNVVFRMGLVISRAFARQAVSHGHIWVNGRRMTVPSHKVRVGDVIGIRPGSKENGIFRELAEKIKDRHAPNWISVDPLKFEATIKGEPSYQDKEPNLNFETILQFYSRV